MPRLDVLQFFGLSRHDLYIGCRITVQIASASSQSVLMFDERLHVLRRDNPYSAAKPLELALPIECPRAGFDANDQRRQVCQFLQQLIAAQTRLKICLPS